MANHVTTKAKLHKPVEALVMVPKTHKLSVLGRKMYNVLLFMSQTSLKNMPGVPSATHLFESSLSEILRMANAEGQNTLAKQHLGEMRRCEVEWESPDSKSDLQSVSFSLLSETRFSLRSGNTWIQWALPPSLYEALVDPERWAAIDLQILTKLSTYTAVALYEICTKYRNNFNGLTCKNVPSWWVDALSSSPALVDPVTGLRKRREWRKVKNEFVLTAIQEINEKTDITIELIEHKGERGSAVLFIQFSVHKKQNSSARLETPATPNVVASTELGLFAKRLGIKESPELAAMVNTHGEGGVITALQTLEHRQQQTNLTPVLSPPGYLRHILSKAKPIESPASSQSPQSVPSSVVGISDNAKSWITIRREQLYDELTAMPIPEQKIFVRECVDELKASGNSSSSLERRADKEEWAVGALKFLVVDYYAKSKHGPDWAIPPSEDAPKLEATEEFALN